MRQAAAVRLLACAVLAIACRRTAKVLTAPPSSSVAITLERRACFGSCPVYLVSVATDGAVVFDGRAHVDSLRRVTARLAPDRVAALVKAFAEHQFLALDDQYVRGSAICAPYATDAPTVITSITADGRTKQVQHDHGCTAAPARLADLERQIDTIIGTSRWIGSR